MRPFLLAGSSSLAVSVLAGTASAQNYTYVPYVNSSAAVNGQFDATSFVQDDYLGSPSGLYAGRLQSDGNFVVSYGTTPNTSLLWAAGYSNPNNGPYGISVYRGNTLTNPDSLTSYAVFSPTGQFYQLVGSNYWNAPSFIQLNDNGTLSMYPGTNGVATGSAITTIATPAAVNLQSIDLTSIDYDTNAATLSNLTPVASAGVTNPNNTGTTVTFGSTLSYTYTSSQTFDFSTSSSTAVTISGSNSVDFFGIDVDSLSVGVTETGTISHGESTSSGESTTFTESADVPVPPGCSYTTTLQATEGTTTVPYTYAGIATYENGQTAPVSGTGVFTGENTGNFQVGTEVTPGTSCPPGGTDPPSTVAELASLTPDSMDPPSTVAELASLPPSTVPEPASLALLGTGVLGLAVARRRQRATVAAEGRRG